MAAPVVDGDDALDFDVEAGLFLGFLDGVAGNRLVDVAPAARQRPFAGALADEQDLAVLKDGGAGIEFWRLIAFLVAEEFPDPCKGQVGLRGHHAGGDVPDLRVAFQVEAVAPVVEPGLGKALEPCDPVEPLLLTGCDEPRFVPAFFFMLLVLVHVIGTFPFDSLECFWHISIE